MVEALCFARLRAPSSRRPCSGAGVAFEVDGYDASAGIAWSVVVKGHAVEIEKMYELFDAEQLPLFPWHAGSKHRFVRINPTEITGRRFEVDPGAVSR